MESSAYLKLRAVDFFGDKAIVLEAEWLLESGYTQAPTVQVCDLQNERQLTIPEGKASRLFLQKLASEVDAKAAPMFAALGIADIDKIDVSLLPV